MKKIRIISTLIILIVLGVYGCQKEEQVQNVNKSPKSDELDQKSEVIKGDFIYRLVTEKEHYDEGENVKIYAELEYIGGEDQVEITHGSSPFLFPITETTRDYEIAYAVNLQGKNTILKKGEPMRQEYRGGGSYAEHDQAEYKVFMKQVMKQDFPNGHYIVNGYADFYLVDKAKCEEQYTIEAQIEFNVDSED